MKKLIEGIRYNKESDKFEFVWNEDAPGDLVNLKLQRYNKLLSTKGGDKVYYAYKVDSAQKDESAILRKSIKYMDTKVNREDVELMISKAVVNFNTLSPLSNYDLIITPKSTSNVLDLLKNFIHAKAGSNTLLSSDVFVKNTIDNIKFDEEKLNKLPQDNREKIVLILNKVFSKQDYKIKSLPPRFRKYVINFLKFNTEVEKRLINRIIGGKILLVDDILTEGTTIKSMSSLLKSLNALDVTSFVLLTNK